MPDAIYVGTGSLKIIKENAAINIPAKEVVDVPDAVTGREDVRVVGEDVCGQGDGPCLRAAGWGTDGDSGPCEEHAEG